MPPELDDNKKRELQIKKYFPDDEAHFRFHPDFPLGGRPPVKLAATSLKLSVSTCDHCGYHRYYITKV